MTYAGPIRSVEDMTNDRVTTPDRFPLARVAAIAAGAVFGAIAALHALWATGAAWPFRDRQGLADVIWGGPVSTFPSPAATLVVTVLLGAAALLVLGRGGVWGGWVPRWVLSAGTWTVAAVLFLRTIFYWPASIGSDAINADWEAALFSPLCLVLALLCAIVARSNVRAVPPGPSRRSNRASAVL